MQLPLDPATSLLTPNVSNASQSSNEDNPTVLTEIGEQFANLLNQVALPQAESTAPIETNTSDVSPAKQLTQAQADISVDNGNTAEALPKGFPLNLFSTLQNWLHPQAQSKHAELGTLPASEAGNPTTEMLVSDVSETTLSEAAISNTLLENTSPSLLQEERLPAEPVNPDKSQAIGQATQNVSSWDQDNQQERPSPLPVEITPAAIDYALLAINAQPIVMVAPGNQQTKSETAASDTPPTALQTSITAPIEKPAALPPPSLTVAATAEKSIQQAPHAELFASLNTDADSVNDDAISQQSETSIAPKSDNEPPVLQPQLQSMIESTSTTPKMDLSHSNQNLNKVQDTLQQLNGTMTLQTDNSANNATSDQPTPEGHSPAITNPLNQLAHKTQASSDANTEFSLPDASIELVPTGNELAASPVITSNHSHQIVSNDTSVKPLPPFMSNTQNPLEQVAEGTAYSVKNGHKELVIRLNPDNLGEVRINLISHGNNELSARLIASSEESHQLLQSQVNTLKTSLESQGIHVERLSVMLAGGAEAQNDLNNTNQNAEQQSQQKQEQSQTSQQQFNQNNQSNPGFTAQTGFNQSAYHKPGFANTPGTIQTNTPVSASDHGMSSDTASSQNQSHDNGRISVLA